MTQRLESPAAGCYGSPDMDAFDAWLEHLFDRSERDLDRIPWYHRLDDPPTDWTLRYARSDSPAATAERIRRLFSDAGALLGPYTDEQVGHGLKVIVDGSCGGEIRALSDSRVPVVLRTAALRSITTLFGEVFAPRLRTEDQQQSTLGYICFMFWDVATIAPGDETVLDVLEQTLALDSTPCQRAALHGLGHEYRYAADHVPAIVDRWLNRNPRAPRELRDYATQARTGSVN
jgi:hypothetical protein